MDSPLASEEVAQLHRELEDLKLHKQNKEVNLLKQ